MLQHLTYRSITEFAALTAGDADALAATARGLQGCLSGAGERPLRGKNLGLLCADAAGSGPDTALLQHAALALGAQVALLRPGLTETSTAEQVLHTARILGRLYDALECVGLSAELVRRIGDGAGVPVFEALSSPTHPICRLAAPLDPLRPVSDNRCALMQAVLLNALA